MLMRFSHGASRGSIICMVEVRKYVVRIILDGIWRKERGKKNAGLAGDLLFSRAIIMLP